MVVDQRIPWPDRGHGSPFESSGLVCPRSFLCGTAFASLVSFAATKVFDVYFAWGLVYSLYDSFRPASVPRIASNVLFLPRSIVCHPSSGFYGRCRTDHVAMRGFVVAGFHCCAVLGYSLLAITLAYACDSDAAGRSFPRGSQRVVPACPVAGRISLFCLFWPCFHVVEGSTALLSRSSVRSVFRLGMSGIHHAEMGAGNSLVRRIFPSVATLHAHHTRFVGWYPTDETTIK